MNLYCLLSHTCEWIGLNDERRPTTGARLAPGHSACAPPQSDRDLPMPHNLLLAHSTPLVSHRPLPHTLQCTSRAPKTRHEGARRGYALPQLAHIDQPESVLTHVFP